MRLYYLSDIHYKGTNPTSRIDDYPKAILDKLEQVFSSAIENKVDAILCGGDLFDIPNVSDGVKNKLIVKLHELKQNNIPFYMVLGSHDYLNYNLMSVDRSSIGVLKSSDLVITPSKDISLTDGCTTIKILFHHPTHGLEDDLEVFRVDRGDADYVIQMIHGMFVDKSVPFKHVLIENLPVDDMGDLVLFGHYHGVFSKGFEDKQFINIGSFGRKERTQRIPSYLDITVDENGISTLVKPVEYVKDVFSENQLVHISDEERSERLKKYLAEFAKAGDFGIDTNPIEFMKSIAENLEVDDSVITFLESELLNQMNVGE